jgi:hypothetical protein
MAADLRSLMEQSAERGEVLNACRAFVALCSITSTLISATSTAYLSFIVNSGRISRQRAIEVINRALEIPPPDGRWRSPWSDRGIDLDYIRLWHAKWGLIRQAGQTDDNVAFIDEITAAVSRLGLDVGSPLRKQDRWDRRLDRFLHDISVSINGPALAGAFVNLVDKIIQLDVKAEILGYDYSPLLVSAFPAASSDLRNRMILSITSLGREPLYGFIYDDVECDELYVPGIVAGLARSASTDELQLIIKEVKDFSRDRWRVASLVKLLPHDPSLAKIIEQEIPDLRRTDKASLFYAVEELADEELQNRLMHALGDVAESFRKFERRSTALRDGNVPAHAANFDDILRKALDPKTPDFASIDYVAAETASYGSPSDRRRILEIIGQRLPDAYAARCLHSVLSAFACKGCSLDLVAQHIPLLPVHERWELLIVSVCDGNKSCALNQADKQRLFEASLAIDASSDDYRDDRERFYDALISLDFFPAVARVLRDARASELPGDEEARAKLLAAIGERIAEPFLDDYVEYLKTFTSIALLKEPLGQLALKATHKAVTDVMTHLNTITIGPAKYANDMLTYASIVRSQFISSLLERRDPAALNALGTKLVPQLDLSTEKESREVFAAFLASGAMPADELFERLSLLPTDEAKAGAIDALASARPETDPDLLYSVVTTMTDDNARATGLSAIAGLDSDYGAVIAEREAAHLPHEYAFIVMVALASKNATAIARAIDYAGPLIKTKAGNIALGRLTTLAGDLTRSGLKPRLIAYFESHQHETAQDRCAETFAALAAHATPDDAEWVLPASLFLDPQRTTIPLQTLLEKMPSNRIPLFLDHVLKLPHSEAWFVQMIFAAADGAGFAERCVELLEEVQRRHVADFEERWDHGVSEWQDPPPRPGLLVTSALGKLGPQLPDALRLRAYHFVAQNDPLHMDTFLTSNFLLLPGRLQQDLADRAGRHEERRQASRLLGWRPAPDPLGWSLRNFFQEHVERTPEGLSVSKVSRRFRTETGPNAPKPAKTLGDLDLSDTTSRSVGFIEVSRAVKFLSEEECGKLLRTLIEVTSWP